MRVDDFGAYTVGQHGGNISDFLQVEEHIMVRVFVT